MSFVVDVPVEGGGRLLVEARPEDLSEDLALAAPRPGAVVATARQSLEQSLDELRPAVGAVLQRLVTLAPDELTVEFGLTVGAETGLLVAKGTGEVHFAVTLTWTRENAGQSDPPTAAMARPATPA